MPRAPTDIRSPISLVLSVTDTYMMFMIPIPPTISEMPATLPNKIVNKSIVEFIMEEISSWLRMVKSSTSASVVSVSSFKLWFLRKISVISSIAISVASSVTAEQLMP